MNRNEIIAYVQEVLEHRFPSDSEKQKIEEADEKIVFACPFCGDSERRSSIKRGNLWFESNSYKCFNGGCLIWLPLDKFISSTSQKFKVHIPENIESTPIKHKEIKVNTGNPLIRFYTNNQTDDGHSMITLSDINSRFGLTPMEEVLDNPQGHPNSHAFLVKRGLTRMHVPMFFDDSDDKVLIFNHDIKTGRVLGYAIRKFNPGPDEPKYIIKYYSDILKIYADYKIGEDLLKDANFLNNYFNILNLDFSQTITLVEGQIDSLFLKNGLATSGLGKVKILLTQVLTQKNRLRIFFDRDKDGTKMTMELLAQGYSVFLWSKALSELKRQYCTPENIVKIRSIKDVNDLYLFIKSKQPELTLSRFDDFISRFFSNSMYDLMDL